MSGNYGRRLVHASGSLVPLSFVVEVFTWGQIRYLLAGGALVAVVLEFVRLRVGLDWVVYDRLTREYEQDNPAGYALAVVAAAMVGWAFGPTVAVPSLLMLTVGDPISGVLGDVDDVEDRPAWWVMAAMFLVCLSIGVVFYLPPGPALGAAAVAVVADSVKPRVAGVVVDDNFSIPLGAAVTAWLVLTYLPALPCPSTCPPVIG